MTGFSALKNLIKIHCLKKSAVKNNYNSIRQNAKAAKAFYEKSVEPKTALISVGILAALVTIKHWFGGYKPLKNTI